MTKRLFEIDPWILKTDQLAIADKRLQESITSIGNGYMGMRGNFEETYTGDTHKGIYIAGVWFPDKTRVGWWKNGYPEYFGKAINSPDFLSIPIKMNGESLDLAKTNYHDFHLELDMHNGVLKRSFIVELPTAKVQFSFLRFMSVETRQLGLISVKAKVLSGQVELEFKPLINGDVRNEDSNYDENFWQLLTQKKLSDDVYSLAAETKPNPFGTPRFTITEQMQNLVQSDSEIKRSGQVTTSQVSETITTTLAAGQTVDLLKEIVVVTSRDVKADEQEQAASVLLKQASAKSLDEHLAAHNAVWQDRWEHADIQVDGDSAAQQGIRFNIAQLFMTYYGEDSRLNVGPKGFTGEKYGGATYWDTEAFIVPMYVAVTKPKVTRQLLEYRYNQLAGAYHNAQQQGLKGALYPMVTFDGIECHNEWEITFEEIHRNSAIAHAIYEYTDYTGDTDYVLTKGADVLVGISRFWADRVHFSKRNQQYMIHGVTGPNEYENNVNNNWYTNQMASWVLRYTLKIMKQLSTAKREELAVTTAEEAHWQDIIDRMYYPVDEKLGIFVQNDGYLDKDLRPVSELLPSDRPLNQNWSWDKILRSPFIKQADVLQGIYFLNNEFTLEQKKRNFDFYEPMTVHESSLSACIYSIVASEIGEETKAVSLYGRTARLDLDNYNNDTADGLHITSMSGSWLAIVQGFAGMRHHDNALTFNPFCPKDWQQYRFKINYRGRLLSISVDHTRTQIQLLSGSDLDLTISGQVIHLNQVETISVPNQPK